MAALWVTRPALDSAYVLVWLTFVSSAKLAAGALTCRLARLKPAAADDPAAAAYALFNADSVPIDASALSISQPPETFKPDTVPSALVSSVAAFFAPLLASATV